MLRVLLLIVFCTLYYCSERGAKKQQNGEDAQKKKKPPDQNRPCIGRRIFGGAAASAIQKPHRKIEYRGKAAPNEIGDLQARGFLLYCCEGAKHMQNEENQKEQPEECEQILMQTKKEDAPKEIDDKLRAINAQGVIFLRVVAFPDFCGADAHENIKDAPDDRK